MNDEELIRNSASRPTHKRKARDVRLTAAEKEHIKRQRVRIALDARDWAVEPVVTDKQLLEMSPHMHSRFLGWAYDPAAQCYIAPTPEPQR